jgi:restriction endonuclease Mrr
VQNVVALSDDLEACRRVNLPSIAYFEPGTEITPSFPFRFTEHTYDYKELMFWIEAAISAIATRYEIPERLIEEPEFRIQVATLAERLALALPSDPAALKSITPRQFEELIAEIMERDGYRVELTKQMRDGGIDIKAYSSDKYGSFLTIVDRKHYLNSGRLIGIEIVKTMWATLDLEKASRAMIATTSTFTSGAKDFGRKFEFRMSLKDHDAICEWIKRSAR